MTSRPDAHHAAGAASDSLGSGGAVRPQVNGSIPSSPAVVLSALPQPHASSSRLPTLGNPQLGPVPYFAFPAPNLEQIEDELPPPSEEDKVPLGPMLDRVVRRGYGDLRGLIDKTLPPLYDRKKPQPIIAYARTTRQSILKYLAVLRWKGQVDVPIYTSPVPPEAHTQPNGHAAASFPTPHSSNGSISTDSPGYVGKGKARATEDGTMGGGGDRLLVQGKMTDAFRIMTFIQHQNLQHTAAAGHLQHSSTVVDSLRLRNPDILTALSILALGDYPRLPSSLTQNFLPKPRLTKRRVLDTLHRLDRHIRYRLRCVDYVPPDLVILDIRNGRAYVQGGNGQWRAELTIINFGFDGDQPRTYEGRWWLTGVEWGWREKEKGVDDPGGEGAIEQDGSGAHSRKLEGEERQAVLDLANGEILLPRQVPPPAPPQMTDAYGPATVAKRTVREDVSMASSPATSAVSLTEAKVGRPSGSVHVEHTDAPLVRLHNFLQHLSLTYQLEVLYTQAMMLAGGPWRRQLVVNMDRSKKTLILKYWIRPRPAAPANAGQVSNPRRPAAPAPTSRSPLVGGSLTISLVEDNKAKADGEEFLEQVQVAGTIPSERLLRLRLVTKWEVGEAGEGGGWKNGDVLDSSDLQIVSDRLSISDILHSATTSHAAHLTKAQCLPLLTLPRIYIFPADPPSFTEAGDASSLPLSLKVPLPGQHRNSHLSVGVNATTGLIEIADGGASTTYETPSLPSTSMVAALATKGMEDRGKRAKMASASVNEGKTRLGDDVGRLVTAITTENLEGQMKALGYTPTRRLAIRSQDMAKVDLHPASTIFLPLPISDRHYLATKITSAGITFELIQLVRVPVENGAGMKLAVGERAPLDLGIIRGRRTAFKRKRDEAVGAIEHDDSSMQGGQGVSAFILENKDLRDMFVYSNALVAQSIIESQLKARAIPFNLHFPPTTGPAAPKSRSPIAGMIPTFVVHAADLLKDGRADDVAMPKVYMQIKEWWTGSKCSAVTVVQLRHRPSASASAAGTIATSPAAAAAAAPNPSRAAKAEGITFDQASSVVRFESDDLTRCVPGFLEQWERLSKVIVVAGTVNKLNRTPRYKDVRMLSFDLRTATLSYSPGYICSITYNSTTDAYVVTFAKSALGVAGAGAAPGQGLTPAAAGLTPGAVSAATPGSTLGIGSADGNPHHPVAGLLSCELNDLVEKGKNVGERYIGLLRSTLPFLLEIDSLRTSPSASPNASAAMSDMNAYPRLVVLSIRRYRLIWDVQSVRRYGVNVTLLPDNAAWIVAESCLSLSRHGGSGMDAICGPVEEIRGWEDVVDKAWSAMREWTDEGKSKGKPMSAGAGAVSGGARPMKLDGGKTVLVPADMIGPAIRAVVVGVDGVLGIQR